MSADSFHRYNWGWRGAIIDIQFVKAMNVVDHSTMKTTTVHSIEISSPKCQQLCGGETWSGLSLYPPGLLSDQEEQVFSAGEY